MYISIWGAVAQHVDVAGIVDQPLTGPAAVAGGLEHGVIPDGPDRHLSFQNGFEIGGGFTPVRPAALRQHGDPGQIRLAPVVDGESGAVRATIAHFVQHTGGELSQL